MHIHLPKPLHGWKEFLNEIFVIVVGVLIALGFEQVVEELHWQHKVHDGEDRLKEEVRFAFFSAAYQVTVAPCKEVELDELAKRVLNSGVTLDPAPVLPNSDRVALTTNAGRVFNGTFRLMGTPVWESLATDGTTLHMPARRQRMLGIIYRQMGFNTQAGTNQQDLNILAHPMPLDPTVRSTLLAKIDEVRLARSRMATSAVQVSGAIRDIGYMPDEQAVDQYLKTDRYQQIAQCRKAGHPLADWRAVLAAQPSLEKMGL